MGKIYQLSLPKKNQTRSYLICGDLHAQFIHQESFEILLKYGKTLPKKDRNLIINGDLADFPYFMMGKNAHAQKWIKRADGVDEFFLPHYQEEIEFINKNILDRLCKVFNKIYFLHGNHDNPRIKAFLDMCPAGYHHNFNFERDLKFKKRGIICVGEYNDWLDLGKLAITHGMYHGASALKKHVDTARKSVIFSHVHVDECKAFDTRDSVLKAWSLPAMCKLNPHYVKNADLKWTNGFGKITVFDDGLFNVNVYTVFEGKCFIDSRLYR